MFNSFIHQSKDNDYKQHRFGFGGEIKKIMAYGVMMLWTKSTVLIFSKMSDDLTCSFMKTISVKF